MALLPILNGPNLNRLGTRKPAVDGATTLADVEALCHETAARPGHTIDFLKCSHEGALICAPHETGRAHQAGTLASVALDASVYTHTSSAPHDAIKGIPAPLVEVNVSDVHAREPFRHRSWISPIAAGVGVGFGVEGYALAIESLARAA